MTCPADNTERKKTQPGRRTAACHTQPTTDNHAATPLMHESVPRVHTPSNRPRATEKRRGEGKGTIWCSARGSTAALAVGGDKRRSLWHSPGLHCGRQTRVGGAGGVPVVAMCLGGRRRRLVEWLGAEELNRSQHTQQLRPTRSIGRQHPHANLHADGARTGGSTFFGAGAGATGVCCCQMSMSCHCVFC